MPINFLRHYYDVYKLLANDRVLNFIASKEYITHKKRRFRTLDEINIKENPAFIIPNLDVKELYSREFKAKSALYFGEQPKFNAILKKIGNYIERL